MIQIKLREPAVLSLARNGGTGTLYPTLGVGPVGPRGPAGTGGTGGTGGTASFPTYPTLSAAQAGLANNEFADGDIIVIGP